MIEFESKDTKRWVEVGPLRWLIGAIVCALLLGLILYATAARAQAPSQVVPKDWPRGMIEFPVPPEGLAGCSNKWCGMREKDLDELMVRAEKCSPTPPKVEAKKPQPQIEKTEPAPWDRNPQYNVQKRM